MNTLAARILLAEDVVVTIEHKIPDLPVMALDAAVLEELRGSFGEQTLLVANLYARFLDHVHRYIETLRTGTTEARIRTLHALKGSAAMMGATRISALAAHLHETSTHTAEPPAEPAIRQLEDELAMFRHALAVHFPE